MLIQTTKIEIPSQSQVKGSLNELSKSTGIGNYPSQNKKTSGAVRYITFMNTYSDYSTSSNRFCN